MNPPRRSPHYVSWAWNNTPAEMTDIFWANAQAAGLSDMDLNQTCRSVPSSWDTDRGGAL